MAFKFAQLMNVAHSMLFSVEGKVTLSTPLHAKSPVFGSPLSVDKPSFSTTRFSFSQRKNDPFPISRKP